MNNLREKLGKLDLDLKVSDMFGLPAIFKEAIKFATMAFAAKRGLANNFQLLEERRVLPCYSAPVGEEWW
jgi:hypothetical protein